MDGQFTSAPGAGAAAWRGFSDGRWRHAVDVRDFIASNTRPYLDGPGFLAAISPRTAAVWGHVLPMLADELHRGVLDVDVATPSSILAHAPGYIDQGAGARRRVRQIVTRPGKSSGDTDGDGLGSAGHPVQH